MSTDRRLLRAGLLVALLLRVQEAGAGAEYALCEHPFVFSGAAVNVVVMPYDDPTTPGAGLTRDARRLSLLIQRDTLFSILKFGSVGAVHMASGPDCRPDDVLAKLLGEQRGALETVQPGHGLVLVWGRLYQEGEQILVQTFARFLRRGEPERVGFRLGDQAFTGRLSTQVVAFPPAQLTRADLDLIERASARAAVLRTRPEETPGREIPMGDPGDPRLSYWVTEVSGDWMRIEAMDRGFSGWVPARVQIGEGELRDRLPELNMVEALVGFLRMRQPPSIGGPVPASAASWIEDAVRRFEARASGPRGEAVKALGHELLGVARLERPGPQQGPEAVHREFAEAARLAPQSAAVRNLEVLSRLLAARQAPSPGQIPSAAAADLAQALALDPGDKLILQNLAGLYGELARQTADPVEVRAFRLKMDAVNGLLETRLAPP